MTAKSAPKSCAKQQEHRGKYVTNVNQQKSITISGEREDLLRKISRITSGSAKFEAWNKKYEINL